MPTVLAHEGASTPRFMGSYGADNTLGSRMLTEMPVEPHGESNPLGDPLSGVQPTALAHESASAAYRMGSNSGAGITPGSRMSTGSPSTPPRESNPLGDPPVTSRHRAAGRVESIRQSSCDETPDGTPPHPFSESGTTANSGASASVADACLIVTAHSDTCRDRWGGEDST